MNPKLSKIWSWTSTSGTGFGFRWTESLMMILVVIVETLSEEPQEKYCEENILVLQK